MSEKLEKDLENTNSEPVKGSGEATIADTKPTPKLYTKEEVKAAQARAAEAVSKKIKEEYEDKILEMSRELNAGKAKEIFKSLNGKDTRFNEVVKLGDIDFNSETLGKDFEKALEKYPEFKNEVEDKLVNVKSFDEAKEGQPTNDILTDFKKQFNIH